MWYIFSEDRPQKDWHELETSEPDPVEINDAVIEGLEIVYARWRALHGPGLSGRLDPIDEGDKDED